MRCSAALCTILLTGSLLAQSDPPKCFQDESSAWFNAHPVPEQNAPAAEQQAFSQQLIEAARVWVQHWPESPQARLQFFKDLDRLKSASDQQLEEAGDDVLKVLKEHPQPGFRFKSIKTEVAAVWISRNIRIQQCLQLTQEAAREDRQAQMDNPSAAKLYMPVVAQGMFDTLGIEMYAALQLNEFDVAESAVQQMKQFLDQHPEARPQQEPRYLANAAKLAEAGGHKPDDLHYPPTANATDPWTYMDKPLIGFHGTDNSGKTWTAEDLKGKTSVISVWQSGCARCYAELPMVQKLFDQFKQRNDIQVLTINLDNNLGPIMPYIEKRNYTFPVVAMPHTAVDKMVGIAAAPRTWIVDSTGTVRFELIGYDASMWPDKILQQVTAWQSGNAAVFGASK